MEDPVFFISFPLPVMYTLCYIGTQKRTTEYENGKANSTEFEEQKTRYMKAQADHLQAKYTYIFRQKILNYYRGEPLY